MSTTVTSKGQVTIPKAVREHLGLQPGSRVKFELAEDGSIVLRNVGGERPDSPIKALRGRVQLEMTTDQIMALLRGED